MIAMRRPWAHPDASEKKGACWAGRPLLHGKPARMSLQMSQRTHTLLTPSFVVQGLIAFEQGSDVLTTAFAGIAATHGIAMDSGNTRPVCARSLLHARRVREKHGSVYSNAPVR